MNNAAAPSLTLPAPGKLNLFLHILGRRRDGYHELQSFMQLLEYGDEVLLRRRHDGQLRLHLSAAETGGVPQQEQASPPRQRHPPAVAGLHGEDNLALRAARTLREACGINAGADIVLRKRLPVGGGLGGGSSDAATTLLGLNLLWNTALGIPRLALLGRRLGADVPFFVRGHSAWAEGVGERLRPVLLPSRWYVVVYPGCSVATKEILRHPQLTRSSPRTTMTAFLNDETQIWRNDCATLVCRLYPAVAEALQGLRSAGAEAAQLSGSGACVFASFAQRAPAQQLCAALPPAWQAFVSRSAALSPLHQALRRQATEKAV